MSARLTSSSLFFTLAVSAGACNGGGAISFGDFPDTIEEDNCQVEVKCGSYPDVQTCKETNFVESSGFPQLEADVEAGLIEYDAQKARECLDGLITDSCSLTDLLAGGDDGVNEVCDQVFTGTVEEGGACTNSFQCAGVDAVCDTSGCQMACCQGTCAAGEAPPPRAEIGEDCSEAGCVSGAYCTSDTQICAERIAVGEPCDNLFSCESGSVCELDFFTSEGTCAVPAAPGESCDPMALFPCNESHTYCDPSAMTCEPRKEVGEECDVARDNCVGYAYCDGGTCAASPVESESCNAETGPDCLGGLECVSGTCQAPEADEVCPLESA